MAKAIPRLHPASRREDAPPETAQVVIEQGGEQDVTRLAEFWLVGVEETDAVKPANQDLLLPGGWAQPRQDVGGNGGMK